MKCSNCENDLISIFRCRYCSRALCSLSCLEIHCTKYHPMKNSPSSSKEIKINSPYIIQGFLNTSIFYDSFYSLDNFVPIYDEKGKVHIVGSGSYGQVYLALHLINKKYYAIKHMDKKKLFSQLHSLESIQKEIDIQSRIDHPNIVKLLYVKETHISYDLVMEYASMGSLFHYIRKFKGLNENKTFSLFIQVVNAINFMHSNDLIHRDIKPENILLYENNVIKLCDFGWCVKLEGHQRGTFCGTTEYMSPELVNHQGYGKEIDVWSLGILLYEMIHGYSPFRPNKPKFNEKDVMENIKNHNLIFGKTVSNECKVLIYHLLDPDINKRYTVEDIYNSEFVKKYEKMRYDFPDNNLIQLYNKKLNQNSEQNINNIIRNDENINFNNINNIINSNNNTFNNNVTYINNNNYQIPETKNEYNNIFIDNNQKMKNIANDNMNKEALFDYINNNGYLYSQSSRNLNNNYSNNIYLCINENNNRKNGISNNQVNNISNIDINNIFNNNNIRTIEEENIKNYYLENVEKHPQDKRKNSNEYMSNINNNSLLEIYGEQNKNNSISISNYNNINYSKEINTNIWNNPINNNNNLSQINNISNIKYIKINPNNENKLENNQITKNNDNNSINYNYYYNFNNYNNNYTNNYYNNSNNNYSQISPNSIQISNYNINSANSNSNNSNINIILDKTKTASTIPTTSNKENKNIILKQKKISEFEVGEEKYNLSDREQNGDEHSAIKININHEQQKINNRKYLSRSDYSIINKNKKKEEKSKNIFIKKLDIGEIKIENSNKNINNSERLNEQSKYFSSVENVEQYLLKNKLYKNKKEKNHKMNINISEPNLNHMKFNNKITISKPKSIEKQITNKLLSDRNVDKKDNLRNKIINKDNIPIKKNKNDLKKKEDNYIGDLLCSLFNIFDSKSDKKNEINILKKENIYNNNTHKALNTKLSYLDKTNKTNSVNYTKNNSLLKIEDNKKLNANSSFIKFNNKKTKIIGLGLSHIENNSEINIHKKSKKICIINTTPNLDNKENNKNIINNNILRHHVSSNNINTTKYQRLKKNNENKIIEIPVNTKNINIIYKSNKNMDNYNNLNNSKIITPKKRNIFNRIHPFILLRDFKKELTNYSQNNSKFNIKK